MSLNRIGDLSVVLEPLTNAISYMCPGGRIVFVSNGVNRASSLTPPYTLEAATKGAVDQMIRTMAKDLGSKGIDVNAVAPGPTGTDLFFERKSEATIAGIKQASPFQRLGGPDEIASVVSFLCDEDSKWVVGQVIHSNSNGAASV